LLLSHLVIFKILGSFFLDRQRKEWESLGYKDHGEYFADLLTKNLKCYRIYRIKYKYRRMGRLDSVFIMICEEDVRRGGLRVCVVKMRYLFIKVVNTV
jgi:hypothetical protein